MKPRILIITDAYLPGWKAGGPIRSVRNLVEALGDQFEFRIITRDRDLLEARPYPGVTPGKWVRVGSSMVLYGSPDNLKPINLARYVRSVEPDLVFLTGYFSKLPVIYLALRRMGRVDKTPTLVAPQGQFDEGAIAIKRWKKQAFIALSRLLGLVNGIEWQASTDAEASRISTYFRRSRPYVASDIPQKPPETPVPHVFKNEGSAEMVFISRISPKKNLKFLLQRLWHIRGALNLRVFGPKEGGEWDGLANLIGDLPEGVSVSYAGVLRPEEVEEALASAHFFVLPTLGENFGHAIYEALRIGRPVLISDRTPWRGLARQGSGWDIPLESSGDWQEALENCIAMDSTAYEELARSAHDYALRWYQEADHAGVQAEVFSQLLSNHRADDNS